MRTDQLKAATQRAAIVAILAAVAVFLFSASHLMLWLLIEHLTFK